MLRPKMKSIFTDRADLTSRQTWPQKHFDHEQLEMEVWRQEVELIIGTSAKIGVTEHGLRTQMLLEARWPRKAAGNSDFYRTTACTTLITKLTIEQKFCKQESSLNSFFLVMSCGWPAPPWMLWWSLFKLHKSSANGGTSHMWAWLQVNLFTIPSWHDPFCRNRKGKPLTYLQLCLQLQQVCGVRTSRQ